MELPEGDAPPTNQEPVAVEIDEGVVMQLASMGFDLEGCKKAVFNTKNQGSHTLTHTLTLTPNTHTHSGVEAAMNWVLEHMGDPGQYTSVYLSKSSAYLSNPQDISVNPLHTTVHLRFLGSFRCSANDSLDDQFWSRRRCRCHGDGSGVHERAGDEGAESDSELVCHLQWNLSNQDTNGAEESVIVSEVSSFQRLQEWYLGCVLFREVSSVQRFHCIPLTPVISRVTM